MKRNSYKPVIDRKAIAAVDREITAIHKQMLKLEIIDLDSAASWQAAWDKHPGLHELEISLFRKRGLSANRRKRSGLTFDCIHDDGGQDDEREIAT